MKTSERYTNLGRISRRGFAVVGLLMLVGTGIGNVQAGSAAGAATNSKVATAARPPAKGAHEGIGVHGHWIIDVKNPDGTLARHVEFENGLCIGTGDLLLTQMLGGGGAVGGWSVKIGNPSVPGGASPGPACGGVLDLGGSLLFQLEQNNDQASTSGGCAAVHTVFSVYCFPTLSPPTTGGNTLTLAGQFTVPAAVSSTQITAVGTGVALCAAGFTPGQCLASGTGPTDFTGVYLTGVPPLPAAITVVAGQSVSVNVQLSFH